MKRDVICVSNVYKCVVYKTHFFRNYFSLLLFMIIICYSFMPNFLIKILRDPAKAFLQNLAMKKL